MLQAQEPFRPGTTVPSTTRCDGDRVGQTDSLAREPATTTGWYCSDFSLSEPFHKVERERDKTAVTVTVQSQSRLSLSQSQHSTQRKKSVAFRKCHMPTLGTPKNEEVFINALIQFMYHQMCVPVVLARVRCFTKVFQQFLCRV